MHVQLEFMLDFSYDHHRLLTMLKEPMEARVAAAGWIRIDNELKALLRAVMENPKR